MTKLNAQEKDRLRAMILFVVESHSGGIKFTELIAELVALAQKEEALKNSIHEDFPVLVENMIGEIEELKVLKYTWKTLNRSKMFVYTP